VECGDDATIIDEMSSPASGRPPVLFMESVPPAGKL